MPTIPPPTPPPPSLPPPHTHIKHDKKDKNQRLGRVLFRSGGCNSTTFRAKSIRTAGQNMRMLGCVLQLSATSTQSFFYSAVKGTVSRDYPTQN